MEVETVLDFAARCGLEPRDYQARIIAKAFDAFTVSKFRNVLIESPTGSGKSAMGLLLCKLLEEKYGYSFGWVAMRRKLLHQAAKENDRIGVKNIQFVSMFDKNAGKFDFMVGDEAQHDAAATMANLHQTTAANMSLGLTATPFRTDRIKLSFDKVINDCGVRFLIEKGYLSQFERMVISDWHPVTVATRFLEDRERWGKSVIYMQNKDLCYETQERLVAGGVSAAVMLGTQSNEERNELFERFEDGDLQVLINVYLLSEGFDCPELKTVWVRDSGKLCTMQMCLDSKTEILTPSGWKKDGEISIGDQVAAFNMETGNITWEPTLEVISRKIQPSEDFISLKNQHLDVRVTDQHNMIYKSRFLTNRRWKKKTARELMEKCQPYLIPVCGVMQSRGLGLSNGELKLLGLWLTDGGTSFGPKKRKTKYITLIINQSEKSDQHTNITSIFKDCGLPYRRKVSPKRKGRLEHYAPNVRYLVGQRYIKSLLSFISSGKITSLRMLEEITPEQFTSLLIGMQIGDGKKRKTADYKPRTLCLCLGNDRNFIDEFQSLCVRKGYRCNLSYYEYKPNEWNKKGEYGWLAYVKKQAYTTIGGKTKLNPPRNSFQLEGKKQETEDVWCVRNKLGTIITRRNGKVAVVGNSGRVLRKDPKNPAKIANIVQSQQTWYPYTKCAKAQREYLWESGQWRSIEPSELSEKIAQIVQDEILPMPVFLPPYLDFAGKTSIRVGKNGEVNVTKRRRKENVIMMPGDFVADDFDNADEGEYL